MQMKQVCVSSAQSVESVFSFSFPSQLLFFVFFTRLCFCVCGKCGAFVAVVVVSIVHPSIKVEDEKGLTAFLFICQRTEDTPFYIFLLSIWFMNTPKETSAVVVHFYFID